MFEIIYLFVIVLAALPLTRTLMLGAGVRTLRLCTGSIVMPGTF